MPVKRALLFFVKYPEPGKVKTRLAKSIGTEKAAAEYRALAEKNYRKLLSLTDTGIDMVVMFDPYEKHIEIEQWLPGACHYVYQIGSGLGERLTHAFLNAFEAEFEQAVAFGSDTLFEDPGVVERAFQVLDRKDAVVGPAADGGYYLIGLKQDPKPLFQDIPWSSSEVLAVTKARFETQKRSYEVLETFRDLDDINDLTHEVTIHASPSKHES